MSTLTRSQVAANIRDILLSGRKLTPKEFDDILRKAGNHERSRVLTLLRNDWGIPVEQFKTGAYHVTERNLEAYHSDKDETLKIWRTNARYVKTLRKVNITLSLLRGLVGKGTYQMVDFERQSVGLRHGVGSTPVRAACTRNNHGERKKH
ncbi:hypothetical protein ACVUEI_000246 [Escherichia coli]